MSRNASFFSEWARADCFGHNRAHGDLAVTLRFSGGIEAGGSVGRAHNID